MCPNGLKQRERRFGKCYLVIVVRIEANCGGRMEYKKFLLKNLQAIESQYQQNTHNTNFF